MTWRDLDLSLIVEGELNDDHYWKIIKYFFSLPVTRLINLVDDRKIITPNRPKSMYIGLKYLFDDVEWKIDIRYIRRCDLGSEKVDMALEAITEMQRLAILEIKNTACKDPRYRKEIRSWNIYEAVLLKDVMSLKDFNKLLESRGLDPI